MISNKAAAVLPCLCFLPALFQSLFGTCLEDSPLVEQLGKAQRQLASWLMAQFHKGKGGFL
jgi:hypothetical protein